MTEESTPGYKNNVSYQALLLGGFALLSAVLLIFGNVSTKDVIQKMLLEDTRKSINQVIPGNIHDNNLLEDKISIKYKNQEIMVYRAKLKNTVSAVAFQVSGQGYGGRILLILGVKADGNILGVRVLSHAETPGLGDKIEANRDPWIYSFNGLSLENTPMSDWAVKKDGGRFDQFSGATITPRAVVNAIKSGLLFFRENRDTLIKEDTAGKPATSKGKHKQSPAGEVS